MPHDDGEAGETRQVPSVNTSGVCWWVKAKRKFRRANDTRALRFDGGQPDRARRCSAQPPSVASPKPTLSTAISRPAARSQRGFSAAMKPSPDATLIGVPLHTAAIRTRKFLTD